jgi:hypothetical protein
MMLQEKPQFNLRLWQSPALSSKATGRIVRDPLRGEQLAAIAFDICPSTCTQISSLKYKTALQKQIRRPQIRRFINAKLRE